MFAVARSRMPLTRRPPPSTPDLPRIIYVDESLAVAQVGRVCVVIWRGAVTRYTFERQRAGLAEVVQKHPDGAAFMCVIEANAKAPDDELRRASTEMIVSHEGHLHCVACIIEGEGFRAAINRGVVAGMFLLARHRRTQASVFATVTESVPWIGRFIALPAGDDLTSSVESIRSRLPAL
jgi:hypothetical protein